MIREEGPAGPPSAPPRADRRTPGNGQQPTPRPVAETRAITAIAVDVTPAPQAGSGPVLAYSPDDPGYGPPGPDWYQRNPEGPQEPEVPETAATRVAPDEPVAIRSPFEPLARTSAQREQAAESDAAARAAQSADQEEAAADTDFDPAGSADDGALGQLRNLYVSTERMRPAAAEAEADTDAEGGADRQLDELLERQRQLISEYFQESGARDASEPVSPGPGPGGGDADDTLVGWRIDQWGT